MAEEAEKAAAELVKKVDAVTASEQEAKVQCIYSMLQRATVVPHMLTCMPVLCRC